MSNIFKTVTKNTKPIILVAWPLGVLLLIMTLILMYEDYATSLAGYLALPTSKVNAGGWVVLAVAALPQVAQIVLFYIFGRDTSKGWAAALATSFFAIDMATDAWYKSNGEWNLLPLAIVESLFVFTLGSEVLFTIAVGFVAESFGDFIEAMAAFIGSLVKATQVALVALGIGDKEEDRDKAEYSRR